MLFFHALLLRLEKLDHRFCTFLLWLFPYPYSRQSQIPNWDLWARKHGNLYTKTQGWCSFPISWQLCVFFVVQPYFLHIYAILGIFWDDDWWLFYFFIGLEHQPEDIPQFQHHYLIIKWWRQGQRQVQQQEGGVPRLLKGQFAAHCAWVALVPIDY